MTGDGLKELVVVTTRGVQVRCTLLITGYHGHFFINQTSYIRTKFGCCMWNTQVLQADLASVKEVTLERLRSLVSALPPSQKDEQKSLV